MAGNSIKINSDVNTVNIQPDNNKITVVNPDGCAVNISQPVTNVIQVATQGPQGPVGPAGPTGPSGSFETGSFVTTSSFNTFTSSIQTEVDNLTSQTGSYVLNSQTGSFATTGSNNFVGNQVITGSLIISGSSTFTNIGPAIFSGSITVTNGNITSDGNITILGDIESDNFSTNGITRVGTQSGDSNSGDLITVLGYQSGKNNTGRQIVSVGYQSATDNSANYVSVLGYRAGYLNTGIYLSSVGYSAGRQNTGANQSSLGYTAGYINTGDNITVVGYQAGRQNSGNNLVAIGHQAGYLNTLNNQFIVRHSTANTIPLIQGNFESGSIGIGLTLPQSNLHVAGDIWASGSNGHITASGNISSSGTVIANSLIASGLIYPSTDGTDGQAIITDGAGNLSFATSTTEKLHLQVRNDDDVDIPAGTPVYSTGEIGGSERINVKIASGSDASKMPAIGIAETTLTTTGATKDGFAIINGIYNTNITPVSGTPVLGSNVYVHANGGLTTIKPSGSTLIQNIGVILKTNGTMIQGMKVSSIDRTNDVPNLLENQIFFGSGSNQSQQIHISGALDQTIINNITASGGISSSATIIANAFVGGGSGITGVVSSSYALTASYAENAGGGAGFPFEGDAVITGSLVINASSSTSQSLSVIGSGSTVFDVIGSVGTLFSVDDDLTGTLFTVNDISGFPVLEASASGDVYIGKSPQSLYTTAIVSSTTAATTHSLSSLSTSSYDGAFFEYTAHSGSNARAGNIMSTWNGGNIVFAETTTTDIGDTSDLTTEVIISQSQAQFVIHGANAGYKIKTIIKAI